MEGYTVPGWPARVQGHAAVTPHMTRMAGGGALQYKDGVTGQPGTQLIPIDANPAPQCPAGQAQMGLSRTSDAPNNIRPNLYYARPQRAYYPGAGMPVSVRSDNLMPVPAVDPRGIPAMTQTPFRTRGASQIKWNPSIVMWPNVNAT